MGKRAVFIAAACLFLCAFTIQPVAAAYKIGALFSVTGGASFLGDPEKKSAEMVVEEINKAGGINGEKIELIAYDDEGDATKCNLFAKKLIHQDQVLTVIGPSVSGLSLAVVPLFEKEKTPLVSCAASYKIVTNPSTEKPYPWIFKTPQSDSLAVEAIYTQMQKMKIGKIAIISVSDGFGSSGRQELLRLAGQYRMEIVADEKYDPKDTDMTTQLTKIKALAPQAIINWSVGPSQVTVVRNWRDLGMEKIKFFQSHGFGSRKNIELAGGAAEGVYCPLGACNIADLLPADHPQKKVTMAYQHSYTTRYKEPLSSFGGHAWDAIWLVADALKAVGPDKAKIRGYLEQKKNFVGQHGIFNFSPADHNGLTKEAFQMVVVQKGDWALVN